MGADTREAKTETMIFIHHHQDTEREEKPPPEIRRIAYRLCDKGGPAVANARGFVTAINPRFDQVMASPAQCGSDYWEIVIESADL